MKKKTLAALFLAAMLLTGCRKGDGSEEYTPPRDLSDVVTDAYAAEKDASFTNVTVDEAEAKGDKPFAFDSAGLERPKQDIVLALLYEKDNGVKIEQAVNYYDADGNVYRYREPLDFNGDWFPVLDNARKNGAVVVNKMSDSERETLWYLAAHAGDYEPLEMKRKVTGNDVQGVYLLYLIKPDGSPLLLARYAGTAEYRYSAEVAAFLNWFRYFYHGSFKFGE